MRERELRKVVGELVGAFEGDDARSGSDGATADVEEDEGGDDEGVAGDVLGVMDVFVEDGARGLKREVSCGW